MKHRHRTKLAFATLSFLLLNWLIVDLTQVYVLHEPDGATSSFMRGLVLRDALDDSWAPMASALIHFDSTRDSVYQALFFEQKLKFQYPPTSLLFVNPFRLVSAEYALFRNRLNLTSGFLVIATVFLNVALHFRLSGHMGSVERTAVSSLMVLSTLTFYPFLQSFHLGQLQTWIAFLVALMLFLQQQGHRAGAGAAAGLIALMKPQMALLGLLAMLRRDRRFAVAWVGTISAGLALSLLLYGPASHLDYPRVLSYIGQRGEVPFPNQSVNGLLNRLAADGHKTSWDPHAFAPLNGWVSFGTLASGLAFAAVGLYSRSTSPARLSVLDLAIGVLCFTLASPIAWEHHYGVMTSLFAVSLPLAARDREGLGVMAVAFVLSSHYIPQVELAATTPINLVQSYLLAGACVMLWLLLRFRKTGHREQAAPQACRVLTTTIP